MQCFGTGPCTTTSALPVRGYLETERGVWRRAGDLGPVPAGEVANAARRADLLVTLGIGIAAASGTRARGRWSWPGAARSGPSGDWYVSNASGSPLGSAFLGLAVDSFPPGTAVLEQRIGRVHRLGQTRPVQVVSFVAKGTIEEGMLSVLGFKRSLFAGVLDGGEREVFLGGSRLTRFVESVETVTAGIQAPIAEEAADPAAAEPGAAEDSVDDDATWQWPLPRLVRLLTRWAICSGPGWSC